MIKSLGPYLIIKVSANAKILQGEFMTQKHFYINGSGAESPQAIEQTVAILVISNAQGVHIVSLYYHVTVATA